MQIPVTQFQLEEPEVTIKKRATLFVCSKSKDAEEAKTFLYMLGLLGEKL